MMDINAVSMDNTVVPFNITFALPFAYSNQLAAVTAFTSLVKVDKLEGFQGIGLEFLALWARKEGSHRFAVPI